MNDSQTAFLTPYAYGYQILFDAFSQQGKRLKYLQHAIKRVLKLADMRGYHQGYELIKYFVQEDPSRDVSQRLLRRLFAYVSISEFVQMTQLGRLQLAAA